MKRSAGVEVEYGVWSVAVGRSDREQRRDKKKRWGGEGTEKCRGVGADDYSPMKSG